MTNIIKYIPFAIIIVLNIIAQSNDYNIDSINTYAVIAGALLTVNLITALISIIKDYFLYNISAIALIGILSLFLFKPLGEIYIHHIITALYLGLFIAAFFPPLIGMKSFTFVYSEHQYPKAVVKSKLFLKINLVINYIWAALFLIAIVLTNITYSYSPTLQTVLATTVPIILQLGIGLPSTLKLPKILTQIIPNDAMNFISIKELFAAMPMGFNKDHAKDVDAVMQFELTGDEPTQGFFTIKNQNAHIPKV